MELPSNLPKPNVPPAKSYQPPGAQDLPTIAFTIGDAAGVGPELVHEAISSGMLPRRVNYRVLGDSSGITPGQPTKESALRGYEALQEAVQLLRDGEIQGVVTGPINKAALYDQGFTFPGQTEFFARSFGVEKYAMCLTGPHLTVGLATIHIPLREVPDALTKENIIHVGELLHDFCLKKGHHYPLIGVAGLNPHAGEDGHLGSEEKEVVIPAVEELNQRFPGVFDGPQAPDTLFYHAYRRDFHAVLCMYHDQGLIPLKMIDFREGVNVTLGLPFVRTSPDHGTAFNIAGQGAARPDSMIAAARLAATLVCAEQAQKNTY
ncbi:4-hydroxythreonine-4-phosphate dehydrogenase PdxA [Sulfuriroseicoccus oceanibius]|uniref:4-hydroxythreonine-4-phosphate dehydrogenase PdxA n=1 Tax=Sulfuriroseicoccus oceanibius TaxID=2707525 RepID=A0A6B3LEX4_9BACT|nr:4-hydroxythreonine-4-phosphate dehydrogenase PdxA [Sulfuriroseicoccus oceanibius]QQL44792.1 4-hydroxythreonine-4-phosphate dehydrogenase PdxA [Sulfuriroseicoccus oceanibius]